MSAVFAVSSLGAVQKAREPDEVGKSVAELNGYREEVWSRLMDQQLHYDEIEDLVHSFNPAIVSSRSGLEDRIRLMHTISERMRARKRDLRRLGEKAKEKGETEEYGSFKMQELVLDRAAKSLDKTVAAMSRPNTACNRPLRAEEREVSNAAKQLMISYDTLMKQREIAEESRRLYEELERDAKQRLSLGLSSAHDVMEETTQRIQAEAQLSALEGSGAALKKDLILLCGWGENGDPEIAPIPEADLSRIDRMNPDADLQKAIANNGDLIDFRHESHVKSTSSWELRADREAAMNENLLANLNGLYRSACGAKAAYEAAVNGLQAAEIEKAAADMQYQLGLLSVPQYLSALIRYRTAEADKCTAEDELFRAMEVYDWALNGSISAE